MADLVNHRYGYTMPPSSISLFEEGEFEQRPTVKHGAKLSCIPISSKWALHAYATH